MLCEVLKVPTDPETISHNDGEVIHLFNGSKDFLPKTASVLAFGPVHENDIYFAKSDVRDLFPDLDLSPYGTLIPLSMINDELDLTFNQIAKLIDRYL